MLKRLLELLWGKARQLPVADNDHRYASPSHAEKMFLHFSGLADIKLQKQHLVGLQPLFGALAVGAALGRVDYHLGGV